MGLAVARRIGELFPGAHVTVMEKEDRVGAHQTGHNSGVVHAGLYYGPGRSRPRCAVAGWACSRTTAWMKGLPDDECGKLVVAVTWTSLRWIGS